MKFYKIIAMAFLLVIAANAQLTKAMVIEQYLLVFPLVAENESAQNASWFGDAFRDTYATAALTMDALVFIKGDELRVIKNEYGINQTLPKPGEMEKVADKLDIVVLYGSYTISGHALTLKCNLIKGRNADVETFEIKGTKTKLNALFSKAITETMDKINLSIDQESQKVVAHIPGTNNWSALHYFTKASAFLRINAKSRINCQKALPYLEKALYKDKSFVAARALKANCELALGLSSKGAIRTRKLAVANNDVKKAELAFKEHPLVQNASVELLIAQKKYEAAKKQSQHALELFPANHWQYFLLGRIYRVLKRNTESEKILVQGLDLQGTNLQKKVFQKELGLLLLNKDDKTAQKYLEAVIDLEPKNYKLMYLRASALYRLNRWLDGMKEIQRAEKLKNWKALQELKYKTCLALGNNFFDDEDFDRAFTYTSIALNLKKENFNTNLLLAKVMRKKGLKQEARQQLDATVQLANEKEGKDFLMVGTEFVSQGFLEEGATSYKTYLKINPKAPERKRLLSLIRKLRGEDVY